MLARSEPKNEAAAPPGSPADARASAPRAKGLLAARLWTTDRAPAAVTLVAELDETTIARVRREALALRARHGELVIVELRYVADATSTALVASLDDLAAHGVRMLTTPIGGAPSQSAVASPQADSASTPGEVRSPPVVTPPPLTALPGPAGTPRPAAPLPDPALVTRPPLASTPAAPQRRGPVTPAGDPFGLDLEFRARWIPVVRFMFERYWRVVVSGIENVPTIGPALIVANHSGAVPADAFMLATALELHHPAQRCLRVLFDKFVDALPFIGDLYRRLGGVTASLAHAELLLSRGEVIGLFPEGIAGVEKRFTERYRLRPFKTGTARLSLRTGSPIVPVAIVGAEEAYPVIARLYRAGQFVGLPWIPVTPLFPLCGLAGGLPLPSKWSMHFCPPIFPPPPDGRSEDERIAELTARVHEAVEGGLHALLAKRVGIFL